MTDLKAEATRLAEEVCIELDLPSLDDYAHLPTIQSALLAFGRLVREEDAKVCEEITHYPDPVTGVMHMHESRLTHKGNYACAAAIRAKALE